MKKRMMSILAAALLCTAALLPVHAELLVEETAVAEELTSGEAWEDAADMVGAPEDQIRDAFGRIGGVVEENPGDDESLDAGKLYDVVPEDAEYVYVHRLFNPYSGEHFYTTNVDEKNSLVPLGWQYEGVAFYAPKGDGTPIYRLYNPTKGYEEHHYTADLHEISVLVSQGWIQEGVAFYTVETNGVPVHRFFNIRATKASASHHYTKDMNEANHLVAAGWSYEGVAWYSMKIQ